MSVITKNIATVPIVTEDILKEDIQELDENLQNNQNSDEELLESDGSSSDEEEQEDPEPVDGWADAMQKVLAKTGPQNAKTMVLAKESLPGLDPEIQKQRLERRKKKRKKREWEDMNYLKPNPLKKQYERNLQKVATRGVVQLFNAVRKHQAEMDDKLEDAKTETKKERLYKNLDKKNFLQMLSGDKTNSQEDEHEEPVEVEQPAWKVLRDDFLLADSKKKPTSQDWETQDDTISKEKKSKKKSSTTPKKKKKS